MSHEVALAITCGFIVGVVAVGLIHARQVKSLDLERGKEIRDFNNADPNLIRTPKIKTSKPEIQKTLMSPKANRMGASSKNLSIMVKSPLSSSRSAADLTGGAQSPLRGAKSSIDLEKSREL
jgi:hypothetical protein